MKGTKMAKDEVDQETRITSKIHSARCQGTWESDVPTYIRIKDLCDYLIEEALVLRKNGHKSASKVFEELREDLLALKK